MEPPEERDQHRCCCTYLIPAAGVPGGIEVQCDRTADPDSPFCASCEQFHQVAGVVAGLPPGTVITRRLQVRKS